MTFAAVLSRIFIVATAAITGLPPASAQTGPSLPGGDVRPPAHSDVEDASVFAKRSAGAKFLLDATEIVSSKLQRDDVKQIAGRLREHAQVALAGIQAAAFQGTGTTGAQPQFSGDQQQEINQLGRLNEMQLSTRYVQAMIGELQQQQRLLEGFARNGTEASFRNFAQQYLPDVKADLDALRGMEMSR